MRYRTPYVGLYESRFFMGSASPLGSVSLGIYRTEAAAHKAAVAFRKCGPTDDRYPAIVAELVEAGVVPPTLLPKWVLAVAGGFMARRVTRHRLTELPGPYPTPALAFAAMLKVARGG